MADAREMRRLLAASEDDLFAALGRPYAQSYPNVLRKSVPNAVAGLVFILLAVTTALSGFWDKRSILGLDDAVLIGGLVGLAVVVVVVCFVIWRFRRKRLARREGREEFDNLRIHINTALCEQWHACEQVKKYEDQTQLAMAVGDVLAASMSGLPVATVSALVVKIGVKKFCNCP